MKRTFLIFLMLASSIATAQEDSDAMYVKVAKGMVINYGEPSLVRLRYLKVGVDVRIENAEHADLIEYHLAALQDALVICFSTIDEDFIHSPGGKEEIRLLALDSVRKAMEQEEEESIIQDLLFSSFIVQR